MAKVLMSHFSPVIDNGEYQSLCFYDGLINELIECGNNVMHVISSGFIERPWNGTNELLDGIDAAKLINDVRNYEPDLCIFFNNSVPDVIYDAIDCPIILFLADGVNYFNDKDIIKNKLLDRIYFYAPFDRDIDEIKSLFGVGDDRIINLLPATGVVSESILMDKGVSFIGTNFANNDSLRRLLLDFVDRRRLRFIINSIRECASAIDDVLTDDEKKYVIQYMPVAEFSYSFSPRNRVATLAMLTDLDLNIYGGADWGNLAPYFPDVTSCYIPDRVYSLKHNQDIYNSSKVCLSISHTQAVGGFPWRSMDVMASNGCLLSDLRMGLNDLTKGFIKLPMYQNASEARKLCKKLLADEVWRNEIVTASQLCIDEKGRWRHRFKSLDDILGLGLSGNNDTIEPPTVTSIRSSQYMKEILPNPDVTVHVPVVDRVSVAVRAKRFVKKIVKKCLAL